MARSDLHGLWNAASMCPTSEYLNARAYFVAVDAMAADVTPRGALHSPLPCWLLDDCCSHIHWKRMKPWQLGTRTVMLVLD